MQVDYVANPWWRGRAREFILSALMIKWLITIFLALAVLAFATPWLERLPIASTLIFCAVAWLIGRLI